MPSSLLKPLHMTSPSTINEGPDSHFTTAATTAAFPSTRCRHSSAVRQRRHTKVKRPPVLKAHVHNSCCWYCCRCRLHFQTSLLKYAAPAHKAGSSLVLAAQIHNSCCCCCCLHVHTAAKVLQRRHTKVGSPPVLAAHMHNSCCCCCCRLHFHTMLPKYCSAGTPRTSRSNSGPVISCNLPSPGSSRTVCSERCWSAMRAAKNFSPASSRIT